MMTNNFADQGVGNSPFLMPAFDNTRVSFRLPDIPGVPGGANVDIQRTSGDGAAGVAAAAGSAISLPLILVVLVALVLILRR